VAAKHPQWRGLGLAMQAYQTRSLALIAEVARLAHHHRVRLMCRLVKGAYWDAEVKRAQVEGLPHYPVFTHKHHTDIAYLACARALLAANDVIYPQFATHNAATIAAIAQLAHAAGLQPGLHYELQRLHGMGGGVYREVLRDPRVSCRVYAPVGSHRDLLAYLVRRLLENGANASFVHQLADESVRTDALLLSPLRMEAQPNLVMPSALFGPSRPNSLGLDLAVAEHRAPLLAALQQVRVQPVADMDATKLQGATVAAFCQPQAWANTPVAQRSQVLRRAADALQSELPQFCAMLMTEAHKTAGDAVAEVREAIDFLRYYAAEAERIMQPQTLPGPTGESNELRLKPRGVWVCISPWNFPLAIFMGQVAAALATGNGVLAKPAEQTPFVAQQAVALLHSAGVPQQALVFTPGPGETLGAGLVGLSGVAGVVFTGSTAVAKIIHRSLAAKSGPIVPLIAETGGINTMVVDSSALPEQVVDAAIQSAFKSAGQRCSALRVLCLHEAVADRVIDMLHGAAAELRLGPGAELATDVGPLIDAEAFEGVSEHVKGGNFKTFGQVVGGFIDSVAIKTGVNSGANQGPGSTLSSVFAGSKHTQLPAICQVPNLQAVQREVFGPVLHVLKWRDGAATADAMGGGLEALAQAVNDMGYGLTLGIHTRIDSRAQAFAASVHVGNVYINRNIIGAVVASQPFGGEGLSGTGPKAGGPDYLTRFCAEQTLTINTTAAGGNVALLAG
jgi:RHH-type transcriptional regulator, proline utilization regulon repressor / proline dehydrogenase / delta 1-pyrroline-5-carboxylate dehydrogenase